MPQATKSLRHFMLGIWVVTFLLVGLYAELRYVIYRYDLQAANWLFEGDSFLGGPTLRLLSVGLAISIGLLAVAPRPLARLGAVRLTIYAGFFIILANYVLDLFDGRYGLFSRGFDVIEVDWLEERLGALIEYPNWVRLVTYVSLGYLLTRHKSLRRGIVVSAVVALADSVLGWLVLVLYGLEYTRLWECLASVTWGEVLALLIQAAVLLSFSLAGAMLTRVPWSDLARHLLPKKHRRYRPSRRILPNMETK